MTDEVDHVIDEEVDHVTDEINHVTGIIVGSIVAGHGIEEASHVTEIITGGPPHLGLEDTKNKKPVSRKCLM